MPGENNCFLNLAVVARAGVMAATADLRCRLRRILPRLLRSRRRRNASCIETSRRSRVQARKFLAGLHILCPPTPNGKEAIPMRWPSQPIMIVKRRDRGW